MGRTGDRGDERRVDMYLAVNDLSELLISDLDGVAFRMLVPVRVLGVFLIIQD